jgi:hypothetical protein
MRGWFSCDNDGVEADVPLNVAWFAAVPSGAGDAWLDQAASVHGTITQ